MVGFVVDGHIYRTMSFRYKFHFITLHQPQTITTIFTYTYNIQHHMHHQCSVDLLQPSFPIHYFLGNIIHNKIHFTTTSTHHTMSFTLHGHSIIFCTSSSLHIYHIQQNETQEQGHTTLLIHTYSNTHPCMHHTPSLPSTCPLAHWSIV